jgi:hypothetical protein
VADTLVYVDLPLPTHFALVTKRFLKGLFVTPEGWPKGSPMLRSTLEGYRVMLCHRHLTPKYRELIAQAQGGNRIHHLKSMRQISDFLNEVKSAAGA